ncbi:MAG TPA: response regulator [Candidatus Baltobacteraceae bacterium]|nr:response regulator [Candidatus Baltobacteraceae bacterium]
MGARILVADDSVTIQKVVELTFSKEDFTLVQARNGEEAIRKAKETRPDIILLDLVMPDKNGYEVCAALRAEPALRTTPIILLAGTFEAFDASRGAEAGANDFITKPFESQTLIGKVKQLLFTRTVDGASAAARKMAAPAEVSVPKPTKEPAQAAPPPEPPKMKAPVVPQTAAAMPDDPWQLLAGEPSVASQAPAPLPPSQPLPVEEPVVVVPPLEAVTEPAAPEPVAEYGMIDLSAAAPAEATAPEPRGGPVEQIDLPDALSLDDLLVSEPEVASQLPPIAAEPVPQVSGPVFELPGDDMPLLPMVEAGKGEPPPVELEALVAPPRAQEPPPVSAAPAAALPDLTEMRQEVASRVAHDLTRELSQKLVERFEKIVWEVVPDLAEILITREIERIRRVAEGDKSL